MSDIALDTNVLVRLIANDHPQQARVAQKLVQKTEERGNHIHISTLVLVETVWVLVRCYDAKRQDILALVREMFSSATYQFESTRLVADAPRIYQNSSCDFSSAIIIANGALNGVPVLSFDRKAIRAGMQAIEKWRD